MLADTEQGGRHRIDSGPAASIGYRQSQVICDMAIAGHRTHQEEHRPDDFHRQLARAVAGLSDAAGAFLVRAAHDETRGWQWVGEPL
jgi:hypothetical protein